jgi:hypothetical protein
MKAKIAGVLIVSCCCTWLPTVAFAQQKPATIAPAAALKDGEWEEIDQRLVFLMVRLANVEASLDAVENAIAKSTGKRSSSLSAAKRAEGGNELMDRKAGGPMVWSEFYGRTAEKFFYHPTDLNTSYHTVTARYQGAPVICWIDVLQWWTLKNKRTMPTNPAAFETRMARRSRLS